MIFSLLIKNWMEFSFEFISFGKISTLKLESLTCIEIYIVSFNFTERGTWLLSLKLSSLISKQIGINNK